MSHFVDATYFQHSFDTPQGPVGALADVHIFGKHLVLDGLMFYPDNGEDRLVVGVKLTLWIMRQIRIMAKSEDFEELTVTYHGLGKPKPGRIISRTRRLE